ncbi:NodT family efflux transporter outer membrane factor (OMF) lipoprotein [Desulfobotulus alkaliphilus]|uniref:NodT family efflux transporter outer membrane factor (OMF) lipoprotein n=1 Tax=Desulfobotulus alkaliphilus TaxID=622671 RepID=A0A562RQP5_9BACT|nr:efflux transporter outer membrane subunit [Desulfobotulus alkaliphilus]TWI70660.1 NodT family efflux transporter outer membrane factor (OMF) lipoprotein [Desulfobotulus alkaliphilus]
MSRRFCILLTVLFFWGCGVRQPDLPEILPQGLPDTYGAEGGLGALPAEKWWEGFGSCELNSLVEEALRSSLDIREALARLDAAAAGFEAGRSGFWPDLDFSAEAGQQRARNSESGQVRTTERYNSFLAASYEVDIWGRVAAASAAEGERFRATRGDLEAAAMTVAASVADTWVLYVHTLFLMDLAQGQLAEEKALLAIEEARFNRGMAGILDILRQKEVVLGVGSRIPDLKGELRLLEHRMALLTGRAASDFSMEGAEKGRDISFPALPAPGLPLELIEKRPDIRAAQARLMAAGWDMEATRALRLPGLTLSGRGGLTAAGLSLLGEGWLLDAAAGLAIPVFDGGRRRANVARSEAVVRERVVAYERSVLTAIREVEDALVREERQEALLRETGLRLDAARVTLEEALRRYRLGGDNFDAVLTARSRIRDLEERLVNQQAVRMQARIALHRALGGQWWEEGARAGRPADPAGTLP